MLNTLRTLLSRWFPTPPPEMGEAGKGLNRHSATPTAKPPSPDAPTPSDTPLSPRGRGAGGEGEVAEEPQKGGHPVPYDENLLEQSRSQWQLGDWESLANLKRETLQHHPDRAKLALLAAAGRLQTGNDVEAKQFIRHAQDWGVGKKLISQILISGVHNSLGRAAAIGGQQHRAQQHFNSAISISTQRSKINAIRNYQLDNLDTGRLQATKIQSIPTAEQDNDEILKSLATDVNKESNQILRQPYDKNFYEAQIPGSDRSARIILSQLFKQYKPSSVIDIGCGSGTWIRVANELGANNLLGIDGGYAADLLVIPREWFREEDLHKTLADYGKFDLLMTLEVAEHLNPERAESFVNDICKISDVILFSAAIPNQGGTDHRNENWPEYWAIYFENNGFFPVDFLRELFWNNEDVEWWYRQNILIFTTQESKNIHFKNFQVADRHNLTKIHPLLIRA